MQMLDIDIDAATSPSTHVHEPLTLGDRANLIFLDAVSKWVGPVECC
jgi:hypothetical protein